MNNQRTNRGLAYLAVVFVLLMFGAVAIGVGVAATQGHTGDVLGGMAFLIAAGLLLWGRR